MGGRAKPESWAWGLSTERGAGGLVGVGPGLERCGGGGRGMQSFERDLQFLCFILRFLEKKHTENQNLSLIFGLNCFSQSSQVALVVKKW